MKPKTLFLSAGILLAVLTAGFGQPTITKQPGNLTASLFADATFRLSVTGDLPLSYQWRFNDADLIGMTKPNLTVTNVQRENAGNYTAIVTNPSGSVTSRVATLTVTQLNSIYAFGWSWTDTHNCAANWQPPTKYYQGRPSNGPMWPEFLSTNVGLAYVEANNYAHCGAASLEILQQVIDFPVPPKPQLSLYCVWAASPDGDFPVLLNALTNEVAGNRLLQKTLLNNSNSVNRLYTKGARAWRAEVSVRAMRRHSSSGSTLRPLTSVARV